MEQRGGGEGSRAEGAPTSKRCGPVGRWHSIDAPNSWKERTIVGGPGDCGLSVLKWELVIPDWILLDWSLEFECVLGGTFPNSPIPALRSEELGRGPDSPQALARPQTPESPVGDCLLGWGRRGLRTIVIGRRVLGRTRGFFSPQLQTHFSKWSRLPLLLSWASRAGARLARPGFPDAWPSETSFTVPLAFGVLACFRP